MYTYKNISFLSKTWKMIVKKNVFRVKKWARYNNSLAWTTMRGDGVFLHHKYFYIVLSVYCTRKTSNCYICLLGIAWANRKCRTRILSREDRAQQSLTPWIKVSSACVVCMRYYRYYYNSVTSPSNFQTIIYK
jgi:hypothetical protein